MRKRKHKVAGISVFVVYQLKSRQQFTCSNRAFKAINYRHGRAIGSETSLGAFCSPDSEAGEQLEQDEGLLRRMDSERSA
jgi:hypothetical protein